MNTIIYNIDSRLRNKTIYPKSSNYKYLFSKIIKNCIELKLSSIEIPNTIYLFSNNKNNNIFTLKIKHNTWIGIEHDKNIYNFVLPDGNYLTNDIYNKINEYFIEIVNKSVLENCSDPDCPDEILSDTEKIINMKIVLDTNSGKFKFECASNNIFTLEFPKAYYDKSFGQLIGFTEENYVDKQNIISENIINTTGENYYFLKVNNYGNVHMSTIYNNINYDEKTYLSKIIFNKSQFEMIYNDSEYVTKTVLFNQPINISYLDISIRDIYDNIIDLNGADYSFTLEFKIITNENLRKYKELPFYSLEVMKMLLYDNMIQYYQEYFKQNKIIPNNGLMIEYNKLLKYHEQNSIKKK